MSNIEKRSRFARVKALGRTLSGILLRHPVTVKEGEGTGGAVGVAPAQLIDPRPYRAMRGRAVKVVVMCGGVCVLLLIPYAAPGVPPSAKFISCAIMAVLAIYAQIRNQDIRSANEFLERQRAIYGEARDEMMRKSLSIQEGKVVGLPDPSVLPDDPRARELVEALFSLGFHISWQEKLSGPAFERHKIKPARGVKIEGLLKMGANLQVYLGTPTPPLISARPGHLAVDIPLPKSDRKFLTMQSYIYPEQRQLTEPVTAAIGVNLAGQLIEIALSDPNTCHLLVGGTTGSGKSEFLRSLLISLLARYSPGQLQIVLVDPKRVTFPEFEQMPWLFCPVAKDVETAIEVMEQLVGEMEQRYQQFEQAGVPNLQAFNAAAVQKGWQQIPIFVCIFDEYADFMAEKEAKKAIELSIKRLGAMARAAGIHLIVATQRPESNVVTPLIRSNLPGRVALKVASEADSAIVLGLGDGNANNLSGKGDLFLLQGSQLERLQAPFSTPEFIEQILSQEWEELPEGEALIPEVILEEPLEKLKELSRKVGWVKASFAYQNLRILSNQSADEIRSLFNKLADSGYGQCKGEGNRLQWCLEPEKWG